MKFGCLSPFRGGFRSPLRQDSVSVCARFADRNSPLELGLFGALFASALWCLLWLVCSGLLPASLVALVKTSIDLEVISLGFLLVSVWSLMVLLKSFLSLPLIVAQPERGGSLAPKSNSCPPFGTRRQSCPMLTARAKAFGRLLPPKPCRSFVPYARCCPVSSFSIRKARQRARHKNPSTHREAPLSKPPGVLAAPPSGKEIPPTDGNETRPHLRNRTRPNQITMGEPSQPSPDATPLRMASYATLWSK